MWFHLPLVPVKRHDGGGREGPLKGNADTAGIEYKLSPESPVNHRRHMGAIAWTKLIPAGNLVSAHHPGVGTTHVWCVTSARCVSGATSAADSVIHLDGASPAPGASVIPIGGASCSKWFYSINKDASISSGIYFVPSASSASSTFLVLQARLPRLSISRNGQTNLPLLA